MSAAIAWRSPKKQGPRPANRALASTRGRPETVAPRLPQQTCTMTVARTAGSRRTEPVATYKLFAPPARRGAIRRDSILERLLADESTRVVLLQGPAGHGKSTLLQQTKSACEDAGLRCAWLSLDETDNDAHRFFLHLQALLAVLEGGVAAASMPASAPTPAGLFRCDWFIARLLKLSAPVCLFLDDFQALSNKSVLGFFRNLLDHLPPGSRVFIGSRSLPDIGLPRLVVNQQALILRGEDLRFSPAEVERFFAGTPELAMNRAEIQTIYGRTEGWPAALQLYRLSLSLPEVRRSLSDLASSRPRQLADYLADNVLSLQSPRVREFLLRTALLSRLSADLCDAVMGKPGSQEILAELEASGLFLRSLDAERRWFGYHALFAGFLAEQLREEAPRVITEVHRRAMHWYREHAILDEALHHAVAAGDHETAAEIFDLWATQLVMDGHLLTIERWYDRLPQAAIGRHPDLVVKVAYALAFLRRRDKLAPVVRMLEPLCHEPQRCRQSNPAIVRAMMLIIDDDTLGAFDAIRDVDVDQPDAAGFHAFELGAAGNLKGYMAMTAGDFESAREYLSLARAHGDRANAGFSWGYSISTAGINLLAQGLLQEALERYRAGMAEPRIALDDSVSSAVLVSCYVQALYEANQLDLAQSLFTQYRDVIAHSAMHDYLAVAYVSMARIHDVRGRPAQALEVLDEAELIAHTSRWPRLIRIVGRERVRRALAAGDADGAAAISRRIPAEGSVLPANWVRFAEDAAGDAISAIRLAIHQQRLAQARELIREQLDVAERQNRVRRQIKLHLLEAMAQDDAGEPQGPHSLRRALRLAAPGGFVRIFLDEGPAVIALLQAGQPQMAGSSEGAHLDQLLAAAGFPTSVADLDPASAPLVDALTGREKDILKLLVDGASNKTLARKIFLSENTVKFHLKNIYLKLGVSSRLQAISAVRQRGLL